MIESPKVGTTGELRFVVDKKHVIDFADNGMPEVLSSPWLIWFMEHAAREEVLRQLLHARKDRGGADVAIAEPSHPATGAERHPLTCRRVDRRVQGVNIDAGADE